MSSDLNETRIRILEASWRLMEQRPGQTISMGEIAKAAGISRQALYLHFVSRTELLIATIAYVDEIKGLAKRLEQLHSAKSSTELLEKCVTVWANYIPEIYGITKALLLIRESDDAAASAWNNIMQCLQDACAKIIEALHKENNLKKHWTKNDATDLLTSLLSIEHWALLTHGHAWSTQKYIKHMQAMLKSTFVEMN